MARQAATSFDDAKTHTRTEKVRISDLITLFKWPERKWVVVRFHPDLHSYAQAWVKGKTRDGKETKFPAWLRSYDPATQEFDSTIYDPWNDLFLSEKEKHKEQKDRCIQVSRKFYGNMIVRKLQANLPEKLQKPTPEEKESGFKDKDSDTHTCWSAFALPPGALSKLQILKGTNTVESKKTGKTKEYSVTDIDYGCDIKVYFDPDKDPGNQYTFQMGDRTPLTDEELAMLRWDTSDLAPDMPDEETARRDYEQWAKNTGRAVAKKPARAADDGDGIDDDEPAPKRGKRKVESEDDDDIESTPKRGKRAAAPSLDDDDIDDTPAPKRRRSEPEDEDDFEDEKPKRSSKRRDEPEDDDDGFEDEPKRGGKRKAEPEDDEDDVAPLKRGKRAAEPEDEDEFEDEKPKRGKKAASKAKDDDDLDDDDLPAAGFDDEDDDPAPAPKRGSKRSEPEDEDDEPAPPKRRR